MARGSGVWCSCHGFLVTISYRYAIHCFVVSLCKMYSSRMLLLPIISAFSLLASCCGAFTLQPQRLLSSCNNKRVVSITSVSPTGTARTRNASSKQVLPLEFSKKKRCPFHVLHSRATDDEAKDSQPPRILSLAMIGLPVTSLIFPALLQIARSVPPNSTEQLAAITALFVSNRTYLYLMAATTVGLAATRGAKDSPQLGRRILDLTEELLYRPSLQNSLDCSPELNPKPGMIQTLSETGFEEALDEVSTETQAILLPLLVSLLLAFSVFLIPFWSGAPSLGDSAAASKAQDVLSTVLPSISQIWNLVLLTLFARAEVRRLGFELSVPTSMAAEWAVAVTITGLASLASFWTAQNFLNMALAILVSRAIQLDSFMAVLGALSLLTLYDATSVFLLPAAGASDIMAPNSDSGLGSVMGSVAMQKLTSSSFQPGLLVTKVGKSLGGALGLGDAVFPSLLASFVKRFDDATANENWRLRLFPVSMVGYLLGCLACEFSPLISDSGIPALVFIVPVMLMCVVVAAALDGALRELAMFKSNQEEDA